MQTEPLALSWAELNHSAARQYLDSGAVYSAWMEARGHLRDAEHAICNTGCQAIPASTLSHHPLSKSKQATNLADDCIQKSLTILSRVALERLSGLERSMKIHQRLNRRRRVGLTPPIITGVLRELQKVSNGTPAYLSGAHALLGYAAAAGVHLIGSEPSSSGKSPWLDFELELMLRNHLSHEEIELALRRADPTFRYDDERSSATNATFFSVKIAQPVNATPIFQAPGAKSAKDTSSSSQEHAHRRVYLASDEGDMAEICVPNSEQLINDMLSKGEVCENSFENKRLLSFVSTIQALTKYYLQTWPKYNSL